MPFAIADLSAVFALSKMKLIFHIWYKQSSISKKILPNWKKLQETLRICHKVI